MLDRWMDDFSSQKGSFWKDTADVGHDGEIGASPKDVSFPICTLENTGMLGEPSTWTFLPAGTRLQTPTNNCRKPRLNMGEISLCLALGLGLSSYLWAQTKKWVLPFAGKKEFQCASLRNRSINQRTSPEGVFFLDICGRAHRGQRGKKVEPVDRSPGLRPLVPCENRLETTNSSFN